MCDFEASLHVKQVPDNDFIPQRLKLTVSDEHFFAYMDFDIPDLDLIQVRYLLRELYSNTNVSFIRSSQLNASNFNNYQHGNVETRI